MELERIKGRRENLDRHIRDCPNLDMAHKEHYKKIALVSSSFWLEKRGEGMGWKGVMEIVVEVTGEQEDRTAKAAAAKKRKEAPTTEGARDAKQYITGDFDWDKTNWTEREIGHQWVKLAASGGVSPQ